MSSESDTPAAETLLEAMANLARSHREHEKFYATAPRETAVTLQRHARTLEALADRWTRAEPRETAPLSPFEGADDLNSDAALQLDGVLFMEGEGRPAELSRLVADLRRDAEGFAATGEWLANAMRASWDLAASLLDVDGLADLLGDRHRIIANDWHAAGIASLVARLLVRAAEIIEHVDLTPAAVRADLVAARRSPQLLYAAAELINHAADLSSDSAGLINDNERRWRTFRERVVQLAEAGGGRQLIE